MNIFALVVHKKKDCSTIIKVYDNSTAAETALSIEVDSYKEQGCLLTHSEPSYAQFVTFSVSIEKYPVLTEEPLA